MAGPTQWLLFPDPLLTRQAVLEASSTSPGTGAMAGTPAPRSTNRGGLVPFLSGDPDPGTDLDLRLLRAGGLYEGAEWAWKADSDAEDQWWGLDSYLRLRDSHDPFSDDPRDGYGLVALVSTAYHRVVLLRWTSGTTWAIRYRDLGGPEDVWTSATLTTERAGTGTASYQATGWEADDGTLFLAVTVGTTTAADLDLYASIDGGITWARVARDLLLTWAGATAQVLRLRGGRSGQWFRLCWLDGATTRAGTLVSSDLGASWASLAALPPSPLTIATNGDNVDPWIFDIVGLDTADGAFCALWVEDADHAVVRVSYASRDSGWTEDTGADFSASGVNPLVQRIALCRGFDAIWFLIDKTTGTTPHGWEVFRVRRDDPFDVANRVTIAQFGPAYGGTRHYRPGVITVADLGAGLLMAHALLDPDASGSTVNGAGCHLWSGWSRRALRHETSTGVSATYLYRDHWSAPCGSPGSGEAEAASTTPFVVESAGAGAYDWTADRLALQGPDVTDEYRYLLDEGTAPAYSWADGSVFTWTLRVPQGGGLAAGYIGARVVGLDSAGDQTDVTIRLSTTGLRVVDNIASGTLYSSPALTLATDWYEVRWAQRASGSARLGEMAILRRGQDGSWVDSGALTLTAGASGITTHQIWRFGILAGLASPGQCVQVRDFSILSDPCYQVAFANPTTLRGARAAPSPAYLRDGLWAWWGGSGGYEGDRYDADLRYQHGLDALFCDSPRLDYRTTDDGASVLVMDAGSTRRWVHTGAAAFGLAGEPYVQVNYNASDSWGAPSVAVTLSTTLYAGLTIAQTGADSVKLWDPGERLAAGELADLFLRISDPADPNYGACVRVESHLDSGWITSAAGGLSGAGFGVGVTVDALLDRSALSYGQTHRYRYLRVLLPGATTATADHRLGRFIAGAVLAPGWPLDWEQADTEEGNVELGQARSGSRWGYEAGPARRTIRATLSGDASRVREAVRGLARSLSGYSAHPLVLVRDAARPAASALLARFTGAGDLQNVAWKQNAAGEWHQVGDMDLEFEEEV